MITGYKLNVSKSIDEQNYVFDKIEMFESEEEGIKWYKQMRRKLKDEVSNM